MLMSKWTKKESFDSNCRFFFHLQNETKPKKEEEKKRTTANEVKRRRRRRSTVESHKIERELTTWFASKTKCILFASIRLEAFSLSVSVVSIRNGTEWDEHHKGKEINTPSKEIGKISNLLSRIYWIAFLFCLVWFVLFHFVSLNSFNYLFWFQHTCSFQIKRKEMEMKKKIKISG